MRRHRHFDRGLIEGSAKIFVLVGAGLVAALRAAVPGSAGAHKARPYAMHFLQFW